MSHAGENTSNLMLGESILARYILDTFSGVKNRELQWFYFLCAHRRQVIVIGTHVVYFSAQSAASVRHSVIFA